MPDTPYKILVVEDEKLLADALEIKFKHDNFTVFKAENGQVGLDQAITNHPDIIILDLMMPVMDGKTMLIKLRAIPEFKNTPVIILTNAGNADNIHETQLYYGAAQFLVKSNVNIEDIVKLVKYMLPGH